MEIAGYGTWAQFWAAVLTSVPQPIGAVIAYLLVEEIAALLPISFAFAAGAMLALVVVEVFPDALRERARDAFIGAALGGAFMLAFSAVLGV
jgi:ZIP family zinc transporter